MAEDTALVMPRLAAGPAVPLIARMRSVPAIWLLLLSCLTGAGADLAQWNLDGSAGSSTGGASLVASVAPPGQAVELTWVNPLIGGTASGALSFGRGTFFRLSHGLGANGGGTRLNRYTLVLDLNIASRPTGWAALLQTSSGNSDDADWFINPGSGLGISGNYGGAVPESTWVRVALVVDCVAGTYRSYLNGLPVQVQRGLTADGRFSLGPEFLLFADNDSENAAGMLGCVQIRPVSLTDAELLALGAAVATNIPTTNGNVPNPLFGKTLNVNGGFESQLSGWTVLRGRPVAQASGVSKGTARTGGRFLHGGVGRPGDGVVRQFIDLQGFTAAELEGAVMDAEAWLRNWHGAGTFDDQVFYRVAFLDAGTNEISSVRCIIPSDRVWVQRSLKAVLPAGTRALHLEVIGRHRRDDDNDSMADDLTVRLTPKQAVVPPVITKRPMLQGVRPDAMTLLWETDHPLTEAVVEWGQGRSDENRLQRVETLQIDATHHVHRAMIEGLKPETEYLYRVRNGTTVSGEYRFRTAPGPDSAFVTAWWGDNHAGTTTLRKHVENLLRHSPDLICVAGDMVNNGNSLSEWHNYWFKPLEHRDAAQTTPVVFARGNHDGEHALAYAYSALPGNESWFAFDYGNTRFIFLDSEADGSVAPEQLVWLRSELARPATQRAAFRVVCFHKPPWSQFWNGGGHTQEPFVINEWVPLFRSRGVDLVICGHEHAYTRGTMNGVVYVVSGGGGGTIDTERVASWPHIKVEYTKYHFDILSVNGRQLTWETFDDNNTLLDQFTLTSRVPEVRIERVAGGGHQLRIEGRPGLRYRIESAADLGAVPLVWQSEGEVQVSAAPVNWPVSAAASARFLRVLPLP
jgi:3',5'-cyclic AMP phosphodiesterase CpdA